MRDLCLLIIVFMCGAVISMGSVDVQAAPSTPTPATPTKAQVSPESKTPPADKASEKTLEQKVDGAFGTVVGHMASVLFWTIPGTELELVAPSCTPERPSWDSKKFDKLKATNPKTQPREACVDKKNTGGLPLVVAWLLFGAVFFTLFLGFVNIRLFRHAIDVVRGKYDDPNEPGEVSHFQALSSALSATVGLGNIAGVAVAVIVGGPGAVFWMVVAALFGMTSKFTECTLGVKYRVMDASGNVRGGPMQYLSSGLAELGLGAFGKFLAVLFALLCIGASFGGGNMFQVGQSYDAITQVLPFELSKSAYGVVMAVLVGMVILGGIKSIASVAEKIVPAMVTIYVLAALFILVSHASDIPAALGRIIGEAFSPEAGYGGLLGVLVQGVRRAAFSNEAGVGSASIAHAAAKTDEPVREGVVALLEPFIDTVLVCTMTGLVIVITGAVESPDNATLVATKSGAALTSQAFGSVITWFPKVLAICVLLFAYSTMISWSYYGERCFTYLFGEKSSIVYKLLFLAMIYVGAVSKMSNALDFSDLMILGMAFPNIVGLLMLAPRVRADLHAYLSKLRAGEFKTFK